MEKAIKQTIEYENYKKGLFIMIGMFGVLTILFIVPFLTLYFTKSDNRYLIAFIVFLALNIIICLPFIIYDLYRMHFITQIGKKMKITEVELNNLKSGIYGLMRFYINIPTSNGNIQEKRSLCTMRGNLFNQYQNKKVKICYLDDYEYFFIIKE